jgi:drug/metabolite transporter (DMT)-like permease
VLAVGAALLAMLIYAGQFVLSRWSMRRTLSLWDLAALRFTVAGLLSLPIVIHQRPAGAVAWGRIAVLSVAAGAPYTLIMYTGLTLAPASHAAVIITGGMPVVATLLTWLWLGERPRPSKALGLALIVIGLTLVGWPQLVAGGSAWRGDALFTVAAVLWALFTVGARRWRIDPLPATAAMWVLALPYIPIYAAVAGARVLNAPRGEVVFQALFQGLGVAIVALALYAWAIRVLGDGLASLFSPLVPVFAAVLGVVVLDEVPAPVQIVGIAGVIVGMVWAARHA